MAMGNGRPASLAAWRMAAQAGHLPGCRGLVDEDQPLGVEVELAVEPSPCGGAGHRDAAALRRAPSFLNVMPHLRGRSPHIALGGKTLPDLGERDIRRILDQAENEGLMCVELRARRLALLARLRLAGLAIAAIPGSGRRNSDPETPGRFTCRQPFLDRRNHPTAKVSAQAPRHHHLLANLPGAVNQITSIA